MFGEILSSYWKMFRLGVMATAVAGAVGYGLYLRWQVHSYKQEITNARESAKECEVERDRLDSAVKIQEDNLRAFQNYYRSRRCLEIRDGELKPDEILNLVK